MIDEKKLIESSTWYPNILFKEELTWKDGWNNCNRDWMKRIDELPKVILPDTTITGWIPCSERLPEELTPVNVTWVNRKPTIYYENIKDIPFTATAVYCNEKWFWWSSICEDILAEYGRNDAEMVDEEVEILAWMPLPESYKEADK